MDDDCMPSVSFWLSPGFSLKKGSNSSVRAWYDWMFVKNTNTKNTRDLSPPFFLSNVSALYRPLATIYYNGSGEMKVGSRPKTSRQGSISRFLYIFSIELFLPHSVV
jgi:hypothetical protein